MGKTVFLADYKLTLISYIPGPGKFSFPILVLIDFGNDIAGEHLNLLACE